MRHTCNARYNDTGIWDDTVRAPFTRHALSTHLDLLKHLCGYFKGTIRLGSGFGGRDRTAADLRFQTFADASLADQLPSRHSTGGHVVFGAEGPVLWKTKKQTFVAISTTEAEFANLTPAGLSTKWVACILEECGTPQLKPTFHRQPKRVPYGVEPNEQGANQDH